MQDNTVNNGLRVLSVNLPESHSVSLRLIVRVGSLHEEDHQKGMSHFIEHCGFRGTEKYGHGELNTLIESWGNVFGPDLNARTGLCDTTWMLNIPIDGNDDGTNISVGLGVLEQWAKGIRFSVEDVEYERKVILEEYRSRQGCAQRLKKQFWDRFMPQISRRIPIGSLQFINSVTAQQLREFYDQQYVYSEMCIVAVGDLTSCGGDIRALLQKESLFQTTGNVQEPVPKPINHQVELCHRNIKFCILTDKELTATSLSIEIYSYLTCGSGFIEDEVLKRLFCSLLEHRFSERSSRSDSPWISAGVSTQLIANDRPVQVLSLSARIAREDADVNRAIVALTEEITRLINFPIEASELNFGKMKWLRYFQQPIGCSSERIVDDLTQVFLLHDAIDFVGLDLENEMAIHVLNNPLLSMHMSEFIKQTLNKPPFTAASLDVSSNVAFVLQSQTEIMDSQEFEKLFMDSFNLVTNASAWSFHAPCADVGHFESLLPGQQKVDVENSDCFITKMEDTDSHMIVLSNGIEICVKDTGEMAKESISFQAFCLGGSTVLGEVEDCAFSLISDVVHNSGMGSLDRAGLSILQSMTRTSVSFQRHWFHRGVGGSCPSENLELLFQMVVSRLLHLSDFESSAFERCVSLQQEGIACHVRETSIESVLAEKVRLFVLGESETVFKPPSVNVLNQVTLELVQSLFKTAFVGTPFRFVFSGDIKMSIEEFGILAETYLGKMLKVQADTWGCERICPSRSLELAIGPERQRYTFLCQDRDQDKSAVVLAFKVPFENIEDEVVQELRVKCVCILAQIKLLEYLRTKEAHVYNVSVDSSRNSLADFGLLFVSFICAPDKALELCDLVFAQFELFGSTGVLDLPIAKKQLVGWHDGAMRNNSHWLFWLLDSWKRASYVNKRPCALQSTSEFENSLDEALNTLPFFFQNVINGFGTSIVVTPFPRSKN